MKRALSVLLAVCLLLGATPIMAQAAAPGINDVSTLEGFLNRLVSSTMSDYDCEKLSYEGAGNAGYSRTINICIFAALSGLRLESYGYKVSYGSSGDRFPLANAEWLCKNILNWSDASWDDMLAKAKSNNGYLGTKYDPRISGSYILGSMAAGVQFGEGIKVLKQQTINGRTELTFNWLYKGYETSVTQKGPYFAQVEKKTIGGKQYWTLYRLKEIKSGEDPFTKRPTVGGFNDVYEDNYFADAVKWAVENGITSGVSANRFGPAESCQRQQIVTFLWKYLKKPEPQGTADFADMPTDNETFRKAISWASEQKITSGAGNNRFDPAGGCTRAQAMTFIWRALGRPEPKSASSFTDLPDSPDMRKAISWAAENGITSGVGGGEFGSGQICKREQIVTFLYKANNLK